MRTKMIPVKFFYNRPSVWVALIVVCFVVYFIARFFVEI